MKATRQNSSVESLFVNIIDCIPQQLKTAELNTWGLLVTPPYIYNASAPPCMVAVV